MLSTAYAEGLYGIDGYLVTVECNMQDKLPYFEIVGLPDNSVREAKERIKAAIEYSGYDFPDSSIIINMAPADRKKEGSSFDVALAVSILHAAKVISPEKTLEDKCFIGELSLSGKTRPVHGVLSMALSAKECGKKEIYVPSSNIKEASVVNGITAYPVENLASLIKHLNGEQLISPVGFDKSIFLKKQEKYNLDFSDVKGQEKAKRAMEVAAAGNHNILLIGPPGAGKSMLAKRLPTILPEISFEEAVETTRIHSTAGVLSADELLTERPFRSPHHTMSAVALSGGGAIPLPGEISLAHNGVLFLDELPEFSKSATEVLRQPLEDGVITVTRTAGRFTFPSKFMLVCAMNPCKCGYFGSANHECTCKKQDIQKYLSKISGPLIDRIDIQLELSSVPFDKLNDASPAESSKDIRKRVNEARLFALERFKNEKTYSGKPVYSNADMTSSLIRKYCKLDKDAEDMLRMAFENLGLSARGHDRILRVARTIADLAKSESIKAEHIAEAIQFRSLDRKYWHQ